jgi:hypothetical protein
MRLRRAAGTDPSLGNSPSEQVVTGIISLRDWYERRARWHRRWFRLSGVAIILLSATLPLLAGLDFNGKNTVIGLIGVGIAVVAALRNFYKWDHLWGVLRRSAFELTFLIDRWRLDIAALDENEQTKEGVARLRAIHKLTSKLLTDADEVRERESMGYFASLDFPTSGPK